MQRKTEVKSAASLEKPMLMQHLNSNQHFILLKQTSELFLNFQNRTKNHVNFRMHIAIVKGVSRCLTGIRTKITGQTFLSKDGKGIKYLIFQKH